MQVTKLDFTTEELTALTDSEFFIIKDRVLRKIISFFGVLESDLKDKFMRYELQVKDINPVGKIFRGENYKLHPYVVLDCPRLFSASSIFAFRTMFWWSHEFSFTIHLQGDALELNREKLISNLEKLRGRGVFVCTNDTPWQYDFGKDNYRTLEAMPDLKEAMLQRPFIKLSRKLPIEDSKNVHDYCLETFELFIMLIK